MADSKGKVFGVGEVIDVVRFGDLEILLRVTAYVCQFVANLKLQKKADELIVGQRRIAEICEAEKMWIRYEQSIISKEEEKLKKLTSSLNLFYDNEQIIRLNTRLNRSTQLHYENKNPLLLRRDTHFSKLIALRSHEDLFEKWSTLDPKNVYAIPFQRQVFLISLHPEFLEKNQINKKKLIFSQFSLFLFRLSC